MEPVHVDEENDLAVTEAFPFLGVCTIVVIGLQIVHFVDAHTPLLQGFQRHLIRRARLPTMAETNDGASVPQPRRSPEPAVPSFHPMKGMMAMRRATAICAQPRKSKTVKATPLGILVGASITSIA
jgi:heme exporter protein D